MPCYLIYTGYVQGGLLKKFGIKSDDLVAAMGPVQEMKLVKKIVEDCIIHNMSSTPRIRRLGNHVQLIKGVER
ncbi:hypothetical protein ACE6H2_022206 [Prunus campanulata]